MNRLKNVLFVLFVAVTFAACGDDYIEDGIEGQWQMRTIVREDGAKEQVNNRFYLFKKGVFKYIEMLNDLDSFVAFGTYSENGNKLDIILDGDYLEWIDYEVNWGEGVERNFKIIKHTSSTLEMEYMNDRYTFRKY